MLHDIPPLGTASFPPVISSRLHPPAAPHHDAVVKAGGLKEVCGGDALVDAVYGAQVLGS